MNFLFILSFSDIYKKLNTQRGTHRCVFVAFRQEYATTNTDFVHMFSLKSKLSDQYSAVLTDKEIQDVFKYSDAMGFVNSAVKDVLELGRRYEQFYLTVIDTENIDCIVSHNTGYGFQAIAYVIAKKLGLKSLVTENGYFRPLTITVEKNGVNALSAMKGWKSGYTVTKKSREDFISFYSHYKKLSKGNDASYNIRKELMQRFYFDYFDPELYPHRWMQRTGKEISNIACRKASKSKLSREQFIVFFVSSIYDPQLPIPSSQYINSICESVINGFTELKKQYPSIVLVIKEHPLDWKRVALEYRKSVRDSTDIFFSTEDSEWLIERSMGVIVINSGVGIEALSLHKPLLCLGDALYRHSEIAITVEDPLDHSQIVIGLQALLVKIPDNNCIDNYLTQLFFTTQVVMAQDNTFSLFKNNNFFHRAIELLSQ